jgi:hypothetical protein
VEGRLRHAVDRLSLTSDVVDLLLPAGVPYDFEAALWDYKERLPVLADRPSDDDRKIFDAELGGIMKDALAFHNAYGGYIVFGIAAKGRNRIKGCAAELDCGDFNKRLHAATGVSIECVFQRFEVGADGRSVEIGLMVVPRRPAGAVPVPFVKDGPQKANGDRSFQRGVYIRVRDECRPATWSAEDWKLLHSNREPPESARVTQRREVVSGLPARDTDLIEFVGRTEVLGELRAWLTDVRSPARLITGIGGLGKTTLAYRFGEEVVETGAGEIEQVIWLTAKQRTFSPLRGEMVDVGAVDFTDLESLYKAILHELKFKPPLEEDEPTIGELSDRIVEALGMCPSLIVVDDIDSLEPGSQRETVSALSAIALSTVRRELAPSRILMTSRIDQGQPPTSVVKISGLERGAFDVHVANVCRIFGIAPVVEPMLRNLYEATSGSPLFVGCLLRLVKLGESLRNVVETWRGQEGDDVRRFAFEREIRRLSLAQGRVLYAVLLLGETSSADLAEVLSLTPRMVRDRISELQAYHLVASGGNPTGDTGITAAKDLVAVQEIVKQHLGASAATVEEACERALRSTGAGARDVGHGIRQVVGAWRREEHEAALVLARDLRRRFPKNGDVACLLGRALMKTRAFKEADRELEQARRLDCGRVELIDLLVEAKVQLADWPGLYELTKSVTSKRRVDKWLDGFLMAVEKLTAFYKLRGDVRKASDVAIEAVEKINAEMSGVRVEGPSFDRMRREKFRLADQFVALLRQEVARPGDNLQVFDGVVRLASADVVLAGLLREGMKALETWWADVEGRPIIDLAACSILNKQLQRLSRLEAQYTSYPGGGSAAEDIAAMRRDLEHRGGRLSSRAGT